MTIADRERLYPCVLRAAKRVSVVLRCVRGIDARGLHVTNVEALSTALQRSSPAAPSAWWTASACRPARSSTAP